MKPHEAHRLLANENIPRPSIQRLREMGFDVRSIAEDHASISDTEVIEIARREQRIILTFDRDYGELIFRHRVAVPPGVIYLRFIPDDPLESARLLGQYFHDPHHGTAGAFVVLTRETVRTKPLPPDSVTSQ